MLWVVEPDRFVVLTPDGDMYEEVRETWRSAQIMTGRRRFPEGPANVVPFTDPMEDTEMIRHITEGRLEGERICAAESLTPGAGRCSHFNWSGEVKAPSTPGTVPRVTYRLRGGRAIAREEILPVVGSGDVLPEEPFPEEFEPSGNEGAEFAPGAIDLSSVDGTCGWSSIRRIPTLERAWIFEGCLTQRGIMGWETAPKATSQSSSGVR